MKKLFLTACAITLLAATGCHNTYNKDGHKEFASISKFADLEGKAGSTVYFAFDSSALSDEAKHILDKQALYMKTHPHKTFLIEGNTDNRGTREYNLALGERRANSARDYLVSLGIPENRMTVVSYGKEKPAVIGDNESAWSQNRRTVTIKK